MAPFGNTPTTQYSFNRKMMKLGLTAGVHMCCCGRRLAFTNGDLSQRRGMRNCNVKGRPVGRSLLDRNLAPVVLHDLLHHRQTKASSIFFPLAYEWFEERLPDR